MKKPELLLPAGNTESFFAALEGGADAVYLGLRKFNARYKAQNFAINQLQALLKETEKRNKKVYITLNTLIKNNELSELLDTLYLISQTSSSAIIIQDLGVYHFVSKYFPQLQIHASTQMGFHNSAGTKIADEMNLKRIILARELTLRELTEIKRRSNIELEIFVHGALCYSFSGMCLFSSYLGGMSANRGKCTQPCRRLYSTKEHSDYFFSLKDIELIELLPEIMKLDISSLKIEGRMKAPGYVYRVAKAYRMAIDNLANIPKAKKILKYDLGREKTKYFYSKKLENVITENSFTGILLGEILSSNDQSFTLHPQHPINLKDRLRVQPKDGKNSISFKVKKMMQNGSDISSASTKVELIIYTHSKKFKKGDKVFQIGLADKKFSNKFTNMGKHLKLHMPKKKKTNILQKTGTGKRFKNIKLFIRIDSLRWLRKVYFESFDYLIVNLLKTDWIKFNIDKPFLQKQVHKIILQLPKFISEKEMSFYRTLCDVFYKDGIRNFMISHISHLPILPKKSNIRIFASENIYTLNDAAVQFLRERNIYGYIYPFENDIDNLKTGKDRKGIVPIYFYPELFYSRMPVEIPGENSSSKKFVSFKDRDTEFNQTIRNGMTIIVPKIPVSALQYKDELYKIGFRRFFIDLSYDKPKQNTFNRLVKKFHSSKVEQPSTSFNYNSGLK